MCIVLMPVVDSIFSTDQSSISADSRPPGVSVKIESSNVRIRPGRPASRVMPRRASSTAA